MAIARTRRRRVYSHPERVMSHSSVEPLKSTRRITQHVRRNSAACPYQILRTSCGRCGCRPETDTAVRRHDRPGRSPPCPHVGFCPQLELAADIRALLCLRRERCSLIVRCPEFRSATPPPGMRPHQSSEKGGDAPGTECCGSQDRIGRIIEEFASIPFWRGPSSQACSTR